MNVDFRKRAEVHLPGCLAGELAQDRFGNAQWTPEPLWLQREQMPRLGFDFLRASGPVTVHQDLPAWFENLLPERDSALRARLSSHFGLRSGQSFALLMALGRELTGAVEVRPITPTPEAHPSEPFETKSATSVEDEPEPGSDRNPGFRPSALTGMQLKCSMSMVNQRLTFGAHSRTSEWIIKFPGQYEELAEVETATLSWASHAGFRVPRHRTVAFDELVGLPPGWADWTPFVFAIERFDRRPDGTRVHHEDLCQALGLRPLHKYGDFSGGIRYEGLFRFVHDACGESASREFARRLGFMIASGNTDAHLKNWGLLWGERVRPDLVPCYDLVCTIAWEALGWERRGGPRLALRFGTTHRFADVDDAMLSLFAKDAGYGWAADEVRAGIERSREAYAALRGPLPRRMADALAVHWNRVPILRRMGPLGGPPQ